MRKTLGVLAAVLACSGGQASAADWPAWLTFPSKQATVSFPALPAQVGQAAAVAPSSCPSCAAGALGHGHAPPVGGYVDDNPLYPELAPWLFQKSHCRRLFCNGGCGNGGCGGGSSGHGRHRWGQGEVPYFAPLPYGHRTAAPASAPAPASVPASAPAPAPPAGAVPQATGFPVN